jgi:hypothetical protein
LTEDEWCSSSRSIHEQTHLTGWIDDSESTIIITRITVFSASEEMRIDLECQKIIQNLAGTVLAVAELILTSCYHLLIPL